MSGLARIALKDKYSQAWYCQADAATIYEGVVVIEATEEVPLRKGGTELDEAKVIIPLDNIVDIRVTV